MFDHLIHLFLNFKTYSSISGYCRLELETLFYKKFMNKWICIDTNKILFA